MFRADFARCPIDGGVLAIGDDPLLGRTIGQHYVIDDLVGEGAMGRVYRAHHALLTTKQFAVKFMIGDFAAKLEMRMRFAHEADATSKLSHPNIVSVVDLRQDRDRPHLPRDGARRRHDARRHHRARGAARAGARARVGAPGLPRAGPRPRPRDRASRPQAGQHPRDSRRAVRRRARAHRRLRARDPRRRCRFDAADQRGDDPGHADVRGARADARRRASTIAPICSRSA